MSENNDTSNESNSEPRITNSTLRPSVLRPSIFAPSVLSGSSFSSAKAGKSSGAADSTGNPQDVTFNNPFLKEEKNELADGGAKGDEPSSSSSSSKIESEAAAAAANGGCGEKAEIDEADERPDPMSLLKKNGLERSNLFAAAKSSIPLVERSGFVFGQNVHERVVGENVNPDSTNKSSQDSDSQGTSGEMLFSSVIQQNAALPVENDVGSKSLSEVVREYEESRAQKRKYEEVETFTGEENEVNIVDVNCKLFAFINRDWEERGRGSLRLNDAKNETDCPRVVFRQSGNFRLLVNTKVWGGMTVQRPSQKSLRLTAMDSSGKVLVFLVMGRPSDMDPLYKALVERIELRKVSNPEECCPKQSDEQTAELAVNSSNIISGAESSVATTTAADSTDGITQSVSDSKKEFHGDDDDDEDDSNGPSPTKVVKEKATTSSSTVAAEEETVEDD